MTTFWSAWIMSLVTFNLGITLFLFIWSTRVRIPTLPDGTTGHVWAHGVLREGVRPLPMWWVVISAAMFVIGIGYLVLFPGFGSHKGLLGWTMHGELAQDVENTRAKLEPLITRHGELPVEELAGDPVSVAIGERLFVDNCAACHGARGQGNQLLGAPDLTNRAWLYGGDGESLMTSILDGRRGVMPPSGVILGPAGVEQVAQYVLSLSGQETDPVKAALGREQFTTCIACHGPDGTGNPLLGAPDLTDDIWLYGGSRAAIERSIRDGRSGEMPAFRERLSETEAKAVAAWVYSRSNPAGTP
ncbi:MAG: cytochrome-c oxidase, cbb3-type subunit III [Burkholderiaceae bacterium]